VSSGHQGSQELSPPVRAAVTMATELENIDKAETEEMLDWYATLEAILEEAAVRQ
jgi:hypothetical protein